MADIINLLPDVVANQIAAGEVVVRPASVVKEMVENSVDAGAKRVVVNSRDGGSELIQIIDDGVGFSPNDARMAFEKHATSKISTVDDIYNLRSFGFRGEALASISAVAEIELRTRQEGDAVGTLTRIKGGEFCGQDPIACEVGANFMVRNLFFNLPARKRFLEKRSTSTKQIRTEFSRIALCYPEVAFELHANDSLVMSLEAESLANRIVNVVGKHVRGNLLEVDVDTSIVKIRGFVGRPSAAKKSGAEQYLFVNGRYFISSYFNKAIMRGYDKLIASTVSPAFFIYFEVDPDMVDVNVHPQKTDVNFVEKESIWQILLAAVRETLAKGGGVPMMEFDKEDDIEIPPINSMYGADIVEPPSTTNSAYNPFEIVDEEPQTIGASVNESADYSTNDTLENFEVSDVTIGGLQNVSLDYMFSSFNESSLECESGEKQNEEKESDTESLFEFVSPEAEAEQISIEELTTAEITSVGMMRGGYAVAVVNGEMMVVDIKRAMERLRFNQIMSLSSQSGYPSQQLLFVEEMVLSLSEYELLSECAADFALLGFDIDYKGEGEIQVRGIPAVVAVAEVDTLLFELLRVCASPENIGEYLREKLAMTIAYRSTQGSLSTSSEQVKALLEELLNKYRDNYTPQGKIIFWRIDDNTLKSQFK